MFIWVIYQFYIHIYVFLNTPMVFGYQDVQDMKGSHAIETETECLWSKIQ